MKVILAKDLKPGDQFYVKSNFVDAHPKHRQLVTVEAVKKIKPHFVSGWAWQVFLTDDAPFWFRGPMLVWPDTTITKEN